MDSSTHFFDHVRVECRRRPGSPWFLEAQGTSYDWLRSVMREMRQAFGHDNVRLVDRDGNEVKLPVLPVLTAEQVREGLGA